MSTYQDYADSVSRIEQHSGDVQGSAIANRGNLIGNTIATLGAQVPKQIQDAISQAAEKRKQAQIQSIFQQSGGDLDKAIPEVMKLDPVLGGKLSEQQLAIKKHLFEVQKLDWDHKQQQQELADRLISTVHDEDSYAVYALAQKQAGNTAGLLDHYDPEDIKRRKTAMLSIKDQLELEKPKPPEPFTLGEGQTRFNPDGTPLANVPKPPPAVGGATGFTLSPGQTRYGPDGQPIASVPKPAGGGSGDAETDGLVQTVLENPALWDQLTPTVRGKIAPELRKLGYTNFGKPLSEASMKQISESESAIDSLKDLRAVIQENEQYIGPIAGLSAMNPYSPARKAQAKIDLVRQRVGKALEGGVLRKEDEEKYKKILATLRDTPATAIYKVDQLIKNIENNVGQFKAAQKLGGRNLDMSGSSASPAPLEAPRIKATVGAIVTGPDGKRYKVTGIKNGAATVEAVP